MKGIPEIDPIEVDMGGVDHQQWSKVQDLFELALRKDETHRVAFVEAMAREEVWLCEAVLDLLAHDARPSPLDRPLEPCEGFKVLEPDLEIGAQLDRYCLLECIGVGGMGRVYRAERIEDGIRQEVAIKVLNISLDLETRSRFLQEQRILAGFDHPGIARLQDFGTTATGISYLVMNLVQGTSITVYADQHKLSIEARLKLFIKLCDAVGYAHRCLVVHRDLKPANVLVNDHGYVQLVDFGIAKVLNPKEHLSGLSTRTELRLMTPSYASPEQLFGRPITTATDVWALGVLLFELLTGQRPFDWSGMSLAEIENVLEHEPGPKASTASMTIENEETDPLARYGGLGARRWFRCLQGDLDNIIGHALAYCPDSRYSSVGALSQDLKRYLEGEPIHARRPSLVYKARKFLRRHALLSSVSALAVVFLLLFMVFQAVQSQRLQTERDLARQQLDKAELMSELLSGVLFLANPVNRNLNQASRTLLDHSTQRILQDFHQEPDAQAHLLTRVGTLYRRLGDYTEAERILTQALKIWELRGSRDVLAMAQTLDSLGFVYHQQRDPRALSTLSRAQRLFWRGHGGDHFDLARSMMHLAAVMRYQGEFREAEALLRHAIAMDQRLGTEKEAEAGIRLADLASLVGRRRPDKALELFDRALEIQRTHWGPHSVPVALTLNRKASLFQERSEADEGARLLSKATEIFRDLLGEEHPLVATGLNNQALMYLLLGEHGKAEGLQRQAWQLDDDRLGSDHPSTLDDRHGLALILRELGRLPEAEDHLRSSVLTLEQTQEASHPALLLHRNDLARILLERGILDEAGDQLELAFAATMLKWGPDHWLTGCTRVGLAEWALRREDLKMALSQAREAVRIFSGEESPERWRLGESRSVLGAALVDLGRYEEATEPLQLAVLGLQEQRGPSVATHLAKERLLAAEEH